MSNTDGGNVAEKERLHPASPRSITQKVLSNADAGDHPTGGFGSAGVLAIGTHHKTGTVWMRTVLRQIANVLGIPHRAQINRRSASLPMKAPRFTCFSPKSDLPPRLWTRQDRVVLHVMRDPRDVLLSGMRYHLTHDANSDAPEPWLHIPRPYFDGLTYQQMLQRLPDEEAQLKFEMNGRHRNTLAEMRRWYTHDSGREGVIEWRYEDLIHDSECEMFRDAFRPFARDQRELGKMTQVFWDNSIFGGLSPSVSGRPAHVRSGRVRQWADKIPKSVLEIYQAQHSEDLVAFGYEEDCNWLDRLPR